MNQHRHTAQGFGLIEILVGVSILTLSMIGLIAVGETFLRMSFQSLRETQANFLMEEGIEAARAMRDHSWSNVGGLTAGTPYYLVFSSGRWATSTAASAAYADTVFFRTMVASDVYRDVNDDIASAGTIDTGTRKITVAVSWLTPAGTSTKTAMAYFSDI